MLELQKIFLIVRFHWISCNKGLKTNFFCLTPPIPRLECSRIRKTALFQTSNRLKKYKKSACMKLRKWSENVVNVENHQFLKGNCNLLLTLYYSSTFYSLFLAFFVLKIFKFKYGKFFIRHSASISNFKAHTWISCSDNETYLGFIDEYLLNMFYCWKILVFIALSDGCICFCLNTYLHLSWTSCLKLVVYIHI